MTKFLAKALGAVVTSSPKKGQESAGTVTIVMKELNDVKNKYNPAHLRMTADTFRSDASGEGWGE